ncbi:MAG TPA: hypothetical protein VJB61_11585 [Actinomycetota bacterium]
MPDLRERLQELADAATRDGSTPGPAHAIRRGRQRRRRIIGGVASLLAVAVIAGAAGTGRLAGQPPPRSVVPATTPSTTLPPVEVRPGPGSEQVASQLWEDTKTALRECAGRSSGGPRMIAHGTAYGYFWVLGATPPRSGKGMCWSSGEAGPGGGSGVATSGSATSPSKDVVASGSSGDSYGSVYGYVTRRAAAVRVLFSGGRPPLEVAVLKTGATFPVNFYVAFYRQRGSPRDWPVAQVVALDRSGREVAHCRARPLPGTRAEN